MEYTTNKVLVQMDMQDKLKSANVEEIIEIIVKLCFQRGKMWVIAKDFLIKVKDGMRAGDSKFLAKKYHMKLVTFYYLRRKLIDMGLIEKKYGVYFLSSRFSEYMLSLSDAWDLVRRS